MGIVNCRLYSQKILEGKDDRQTPPEPLEDKKDLGLVLVGVG